MDNSRNMILAVVLSALVLFGWSLIAERYFPTATPPKTEFNRAGEQVALPQPQADPAADAPAAVRDRAAVLRESPRVAINTPALAGSVNLVGARIDDLVLRRYPERLGKGSPPIRLLSPAGAPASQFASFGWTAPAGVAVPGNDTRWTASAARLGVGQPVRLSWDNGQGQSFAIDLSVDEDFLFTARQTVANRGGRPVTVTPYGLVSRTGRGVDVGTWINHVGPIGAFAGAADYGVGYDDVVEAGGAGVTPKGEANWAGFSDKYWAAVLVPPAGANARFQPGRAPDSFQATAAAPTLSVEPSAAKSVTTRFFAGAKEVDLLATYADGVDGVAGIPRFDLLIDWGWFAAVERPFFWLLKTIEGVTGNWGLAIILLTVLVRLLMFPIAQRQFASMAAMRRLQPKLKSLQERHKDDKEKLQKEMMQLYKTEKVNPLAGCLPIVIQIPVFFALYKVLVLVVELRHQPFALWIRDLSAPDPATPLNGFGTFGFTLPHLLAIGVLPILVGVTQYLSFKQNPPPDETQAKVFGIMPWVLMFVMAPFAAGLQLYWMTTNIFTVFQQRLMYARHPELKNPPKAPAAKPAKAK